MSPDTPLLSIITPCYNHGKYLDEAIASIAYNKIDYAIEHITVNDGSTDPFTINKLKELEDRGHKIIHQENLGLATARNNAITIAKGKYILPLDSDNKLHENYLTNAIAILEQNNDIDVVYGDCEFFGEETRYWKNKKFDIIKILEGNHIDACAVFRKEMWCRVKGYDAQMPVVGNEDWEMWIAMFFAGANLFYLNKLCFYYRVTKESMRLNITNYGLEENRNYIMQKYSNEFYEFFCKYFHKIEYFKKNRYKSAISHLLGRVIL